MQVLIVGCGIVGAAIAYELSRIPGLDITVVDRQATPATATQTTYQSGTGAALGLLMANICQKTKGRNLRRRWAGIDWYQRVIPEIEASTGQTIPVNRQGLLMLEFDPARLAAWEKLVAVRQRQKRRLEIWDTPHLQAQAPHLNQDYVQAAIYSPDDHQIHPAIAAQVLITAAMNNGVTFRFGIEVEQIQHQDGCATQVLTNQGSLRCEQLILAAGLGAFPLTRALHQSIELRPVLGQAIQLRLPRQLGLPEFQPVFTGHDIHIVPLGQIGDAWEYWVGATVEFPSEADVIAVKAANPDPAMFQTVMQGAITMCPALALGETIRQWSGIRPRPQGRPAPVIERLPGYENVIVAAGHYRNGVLLAPTTAIEVREMLIHGDSQSASV